MKKTSKGIMILALAGILSIGSAMTAMAAWEMDASGWKYGNGDGTYKTSEWFKDASAPQEPWYHFKSTGIMDSNGWFKDTDGKWYFLAWTGAMQRDGIFEIDGATYYLNLDGSLYVGDMIINGDNYTFTETGLTGGRKIATSEKWYGYDTSTHVGGTRVTASTGNTISGGGSSSSSGGGGGSAYISNVSKINAQIATNVRGYAANPVPGVTNLGLSGNTLTVSTDGTATGSSIVAAAQSTVMAALTSAQQTDGVTIKDIVILTPPSDNTTPSTTVYTGNSVNDAMNAIQAFAPFVPTSGRYTVSAYVSGSGNQTWTVNIQ